MIAFIAAMTTACSPPENGPSRRPVIIISDGHYYSDDAVAIAAIISSGRFDVRGIISTAGNVTAEQSESDLKRLLADLEVRDVPVIRGPSLAIHAERWRHYASAERPLPGFAGVFDQLQAAPNATLDAQDFAGADFLIREARAHHGELCLLLLAPATVLAQALQRGQLPLQEVYAMGGAFDVPGNASAAAEFNVWFDPESWDRLARSGLHLTLVALDATARVTYAGAPRPRAAESLCLQHLAEYLRRRESAGASMLMWDEVVAATLLESSVIERSRLTSISVSTTRDLSYGQTFVQEGGSVRLVTGVDVERIEPTVIAALASFANAP